MDLDKEFYIVIQQFSDGTCGVAECEVAQMEEVEATNVVAEATKVLAVIYFNPVEGHSRDVTEDFARNWLAQLDITLDGCGNPDPTIPEFIKDHVSDLDAILEEIVQDIKDQQDEKNSIQSRWNNR